MKRIDLKKNGDTGYFQIKNESKDTAELTIFGTIADEKWWEEDVVPKDVKALLDEVKGTKNLNIYINSGGGSVFAGMAIYNMLKRVKAKKTVYVEGLAASIASVIAFCGDVLIIPKNAYLMVHKAWTIAAGNADEMLKTAETLETIDAGMLEVYKAHFKPGVQEDAFKAMVEAETWMTGEMAAEYFNIETSEPLTAVAYTGNLKYRNTPAALKKQKRKRDKKENTKRALARLNLELESSF